MHAPYERSHLVLVEVSNDVRFHPVLLEDKMLTLPRAFSGVAVSVRGLLQDSFDFPMWTSAEAKGFSMGFCSTGGVLTGHLLRASCHILCIGFHRSSILRSRDVDPECRALLYSVVVC